MKRFIEGFDRSQVTLFPECVEDWIGENNPVRVIDAFVEELDLGGLGFSGVDPKAAGRPKAVNNRDRNMTVAKMKRRKDQIDKSVAGYLHQLDSDRNWNRPEERLAAEMRLESPYDEQSSTGATGLRRTARTRRRPLASAVSDVLSDGTAYQKHGTVMHL